MYIKLGHVSGKSDGKKNCAKQQSKQQTTTMHTTSFSLSVTQTSKVARETSFHAIVFWVMALCSLVGGYQGFRGMYSS